MMKTVKLCLLAVLALGTVPAFAQENTTRERLSEIEEMAVSEKEGCTPREIPLFTLEGASEWGIGIHSLTSEMLPSDGKDWHFYLMLLDARIQPASWISLHVGAGLSWDYYRSRKSVFYLDEGKNVQVRDMTDAENEFGRKFSLLRETSVILPATLQFHAGDFSIRFGAEAIYGLGAMTRYKFKKPGEQKDRTRGGRVYPWNYDFQAAVSYNQIGVFVKYLPTGRQLFREPGPQIDTRWTVGLCFGF